MHSLPPHIAHVFDDQHANARNGRRANRSRVESKRRFGRRRSR